MAEAATAVLDASAQGSSSSITVVPDPFTLVPYDVAEITALIEEAAALAEIPPGVDIRLTVDEELFAPLTGHMSDVVDGRIEAWISGGNFEATSGRATSRPTRPASISRSSCCTPRTGCPASSPRRATRGSRRRTRRLGHVRVRPGTSPRSPRPATAGVVRLPAAARLHRRGRCHVRALLVVRPHLVGGRP